MCATHIPTGLEAKCAEHVSQWQNKDAALDTLAVLVQEHVTKELRDSLGELVKALADMTIADSTAPSLTKGEEAELTARMEEFITALNQPAERPEEDLAMASGVGVVGPAVAPCRAEPNQVGEFLQGDRVFAMVI